jgi:hypothetical protein
MRSPMHCAKRQIAQSGHKVADWTTHASKSLAAV